ncbi:hypothetical protein [Serinicoccus marinus]|uniref:hypothetical protein n=1 Tax=Serinicoccus marinus TaxID=247333 RepID=UPI00122E90D5|nr:hypothetical protein [Serinicoccus marinus]
MPQPDQLLPGAVRRLLPSAVRARRAEAGRVAAERAERETEERERRDRQERRRRRVAERRDAARAADPQIRIIDADGLQGPGREVVAFTARGPAIATWDWSRTSWSRPGSTTSWSEAARG